MVWGRGSNSPAFLSVSLAYAAIKHTYHVYNKLCNIVFHWGQILFWGFAFLTLVWSYAIYVIGVDQPWVAFLARKYNFDFCSKSSFFWS